MPATDFDRRLRTRPLMVRAQTIDAENRSVEGVIATEAPVGVWDWDTRSLIDEILLTSGAHLPEQVPLLRDHDQYNLDAVLGSGRSMRREDAGIVGRLFFARDDPEADRAWNKVRQGHLRDLSVGYWVDESTDIPAGQTATVAGREFRARERLLRIATRWSVKEVSLVAIGADQAAKLREGHHNQGFSTMNQQLRAYLESIGLPAGSSEADAEKFRQGLSGETRTRADQLATAADPATPPPSDPPAQNQQRAPQQPPADPLAQRQNAEGRMQNPSTVAPVDPAAVARTVLAEERDRVRRIHELAGEDVPAQLRERATVEGWDLNRAQAEFLTAIRAQRGSGGPGIHVRDSERDTNVRSLAAGLLMSQGLDPTKHKLHRNQGLPLSADKFTEQDADRAECFRGMSAPDLFRECLRIDTGRWYPTIQEALSTFGQRTTVSGASFTNIFTTNVYARLMQGWTTIGDTTVGWCDEEDVPSFMLQEDVNLQADARLEVLARGDTAKHATASDSHETYRIHRFAKQFVVDDQDIIDDRLGAIMRMQQEMGEAARRLRPDGVYSMMLGNPTLVADGAAVFNATAVTTAGGHANLGTDALGASALETAISAMGQQRINNNVLNIRPKFLIVPAALEWTARGLTASAALAKLFADTPESRYSVINLIAQEGLRVVIDDRLGASGVVTPMTGLLVAGSNTAWYLAAGGTKSIRVAYLRGTGRQPVLRSFLLDRGQFGMGWDIHLDIGAAFMDYRPWYASSGAD